MAILRPGGRTFPNALARSKQLSFALDFSDPSATPWIIGGAMPGVVDGNGARDWTRRGAGLTGSTGSWSSSTGASNTYALNTTAGTWIFAGIAADASSTATERAMISGPNNYPTGPMLDAVRYSDGNCYVGWLSTSDKRITFSNSGLWSAGDTVVMGLTWDTNVGQVAYVNGVQVGSNSSTGYGSTAGQPVYIGRIAAGAWYWNGSDGAILYNLFFDRVLTPQEMADAANDIWWWRQETIPTLHRDVSGGYTLTADSAAFTLTGQATGLRASRLLTAAQATYTLTGPATGLTAGRRVTADVAAYTLTGTDTALSRGRLPLTADAGAFTLTGIDAGLLASRQLLAETSALSWVGRDANLLYSGAPIVSTGGIRRTRRGTRRIYLPQPPDPTVITPIPTKPAPKADWDDDDEDAWILLS